MRKTPRRDNNPNREMSHEATADSGEKGNHGAEIGVLNKTKTAVHRMG